MLPDSIIWFLIVPLAVIVLVLVLLVRLLRDKPSASTEAAMDEAQMIQELYRGMNRMEQRIETLETLLQEHNTSPGFGQDRYRNGEENR